MLLVVSKLRYNIFPKFKIYIKIVIETSSGDIFECIFSENILDRVKILDTTNFIDIIGSGVIANGLFYVIAKDVWIFS